MSASLPDCFEATTSSGRSRHETGLPYEAGNDVLKLGESAVAIEHVGSTAIPGIHAKPIIDIVVGVRSLDDAMKYKDELALHKIIFRGEDNPGQLLFIIGDDDIRTHHIHFVPWAGEAWQNYIAFRDYLCSNPEAAKAYDELKLRLSSMYSGDRKTYTASKASFINDTIAEARKRAVIR